MGSVKNGKVPTNKAFNRDDQLLNYLLDYFFACLIRVVICAILGNKIEIYEKNKKDSDIFY